MIGVQTLSFPISGQPGFKRTPASIAAVTPKWRGFLLLAHELAETPRCLWAARVAVPAGVMWEIAGNGDLKTIEALLPKGERIEAQDAARGTKRIAAVANGRLEIGRETCRERGCQYV